MVFGQQLMPRPDSVDHTDIRYLHGFQRHLFNIQIVAFHHDPILRVNIKGYLAIPQFLGNRRRFWGAFDHQFSVIVWQALQLIVGNTDMTVLLNIFIGKIGTHKIIAPVGCGNPAHLAQCRQVQPLIIFLIGGGIIEGQKTGVFNIGR